MFSSSSTRSENKENIFTDDRSATESTNSNMLRDIETLIGNMEQTQAKQNEHMLKNIENMLGPLLSAKQSRPQSSNSDFSANSYERIYVKSPIPVKMAVAEQQGDFNVENDVRNFMEKHIQEVNPDVVEQVSQLLLPFESFLALNLLPFSDPKINFQVERDLIDTPDQSHDSVDMISTMQELIDEADLSEFEEMEGNDTDSEEILSINEFLKNQMGSEYGSVLEPTNHVERLAGSEHSNVQHIRLEVGETAKMETILPTGSSSTGENTGLLSQKDGKNQKQRVNHREETILQSESLNGAVRKIVASQEKVNGQPQKVVDEAKISLPKESMSTGEKVSLAVQKEKSSQKPKVTKKHQTTSKKSSDKTQHIPKNDTKMETVDSTASTSQANNDIRETSTEGVPSPSQTQYKRNATDIADKKEHSPSNPEVVSLKSTKALRNEKKSKPAAQPTATAAISRQDVVSTKNDNTPADPKAVSSGFGDLTPTVIVSPDKIVLSVTDQVTNALQQQVTDSSNEATSGDISIIVQSSLLRDIQGESSLTSVSHVASTEEPEISLSSSQMIIEQIESPKQVKNVAKTMKKVSAQSKGRKASSSTKKAAHKRQAPQSVPNIIIESDVVTQAAVNDTIQPRDVGQSQPAQTNERSNIFGDTQNNDTHREVVEAHNINENDNQIIATGEMAEEQHISALVDIDVRQREEIIEELEVTQNEHVNDATNDEREYQRVVHENIPQDEAQDELTIDEGSHEVEEEISVLETHSTIKNNDMINGNDQTQVQYEQTNNEGNHEIDEGIAYQETHSTIRNNEMVNENGRTLSQADQETTSNENTEAAESKPPQNLSDMVHDTKRLIQQMKDEINSDIASFVSDPEYSDYSDTESQSWTEGEYTGEEVEEEYEDEEDYEEEEEDDYDDYETEEDDYTDDDKNDSEVKQTISGESDDELVYYDNEEEVTEQVRHFTPAIRSSQSVESENYVEAQEHLEFQNIASDGNDDELFEALLPPPAFSDEVGDIQQINDSVQAESSDQTISNETKLQSENSQRNSVEIQNGEETDGSDQSYEDSVESDAESDVVNVEFETIKRNSIDLQENAIFIQQQLNKATTVIVEKVSTEHRDEVSPVVEIPNVENASNSEGNTVDREESSREDPINLPNEVATIQSTLNVAPGNEDSKQVREDEEEVTEEEEEEEEETEEEEEVEEAPLIHTITQTTSQTQQNERVEETQIPQINNMTDIVVLSPTGSEVSSEVVNPSNEAVTTSIVINTEVETVISNVDDHTSEEIIPAEETPTAKSVQQKVTELISEAASTSSKAGTSTETRDNQQASSSKSTEVASQSPSSSKQTQLPKQAKTTTKTVKKIPVRKTSLALSGPFGAVRTTNVRAMQQELLNKTTEKPSSTKPSKIVPPKVYTKASITSLTERITKFIKPFSNTSTSKEPVAVVKNVIPKKKYHETCFSDDNPTSDEESMPVRRHVPIRQQSLPNIMATQLSEEEETPEVRNTSSSYYNLTQAKNFVLEDSSSTVS